METREGPAKRTVHPAVLVIEDDGVIREAVARHLTDALAADVRSCADLGTALRAPVPDVIVLDLGLPDAEGLESLIRLREAMPSALILVATARGTLADRLEGLRQGADDYVVKPFSLLEVAARVEALLRRRLPSTAPEPAGLQWDEGARHVLRRGEPLPLTPLEYLVFSALASRPGQALSRPDLLRLVIGPNFYGYERLIDVHVGHLRHKLDAMDPFRYIATARGYGYRWDGPDLRREGSGHAR